MYLHGLRNEVIQKYRITLQFISLYYETVLNSSWRKTSFRNFCIIMELNYFSVRKRSINE